MRIDLSLNQVKEVDRWFDRSIHKHHEKRFGIVPWPTEVAIVSRWIEPHGFTQRSFPKTSYPRDVPPMVEDDDGDIEMTDADW